MSAVSRRLDVRVRRTRPSKIGITIQLFVALLHYLPERAKYLGLEGMEHRTIAKCIIQSGTRILHSAYFCDGFDTLIELFTRPSI
jgi:hypothetical protein